VRKYHGHASECKRGKTRGREEEMETLKYFFLGILFGGVSPTRHPFAFYTNYRGHAFENIVVMLLAQERENERGGKGIGDVILSWGYHCGGIP